MVREVVREGGREVGRTTDEMLRELGRTVPGGRRRNIVNTQVCGVVWCGVVNIVTTDYQGVCDGVPSEPGCGVKARLPEV